MALFSRPKEHWLAAEVRVNDSSCSCRYDEFYRATLSFVDSFKKLPPQQLIWISPHLPKVRQLSAILACLETEHLAIPTAPGTPACESLNLQQQIRPQWSLTDSGQLQPTQYAQEFRPLKEGGVLFLTSGSTGARKWVVQYKSQLVANAYQASQGQSLDRHSSVLAPLTLAHTGGLNMQTLPALLVGANLEFTRGLTAKDFQRLINGHFSHTLMVPHHLRKFIRFLQSNSIVSLSSPLTVLTGSAPISLDLLKDCLNISGLHLHSVYGLTEVGPYLCSFDSKNDKDFIASFDEPLSGFPLGRFHSQHQATLDPSGEIFIQSPAINHFLHEEKNGWKIEPCSQNLFGTGDLGYKCGDFFFFTGRKNRRINLSGFKIRPEEIEELLMQYPKVERAIVYPQPDGDFFEVPATKLTVNSECSIYELKTFLKQRLSSLKIPRHWEIVEVLPMTTIYKSQAS